MSRYRSLPFMSYRGRHRAPDPRLVRARQAARAGGGATLIAVLGAALALTASTGGPAAASASRPATTHHAQQARAVALKAYALAAATATHTGRPHRTVSLRLR